MAVAPASDVLALTAPLGVNPKHSLVGGVVLVRELSSFASENKSLATFLTREFLRNCLSKGGTGSVRSLERDGQKAIDGGHVKLRRSVLAW